MAVQAPLPIRTEILRRAILEAARHVVDMVHAEENIISARNIRIERGGAIGGWVLERKVQGHQTMVAPMPGFRLFAHGFREQLLPGHLHGGWKIDSACDEFAAINGAAIIKFHAGCTPIGDRNFLNIRAGDDFTAARLHNPRQGKGQRHRAADRQCEARYICKDGRKDDAGAGHVLRGNHMHIRCE